MRRPAVNLNRQSRTSGSRESADGHITQRHYVAVFAFQMKAMLVLALILFASQAAFSSTDIYEIRGTTDTDIYQIDPATGVLTTIYNNYPGGSSATLAQRASDGMLFYAINVANGQVYRFNPATPNIAPVALTNTLGGAVPASFRMDFSAGGTLYYLPDSGRLYTINQVTGVATAGPTITGLGSGGDMAFSGGTLYVVNSSRQLFTAPLGGGAATLLGTITFPGGITPATLGLVFDGSGNLRVETQNPNNLYTVSLATLAASSPVALGGGTTATGDLGGINVPDPDLSITKTNSAAVYQGGPVSYTIVVTNKTAAYAVTGTVVDNVTANITGVTWTCSASAGSTCTAASGAGNAINTSATLQPNGTATYIVSGTVALGATGNLVNTATVAVPSFLVDANPGDNSATDSDPITLSADLSITKTDGINNINPGGAITYTIVVRNAATSGIVANGVIVTDTVPALITGVTWTCGAATLGATCGAASGSGNSISTTANLPIGSTVTYTVSGTLSVTAPPGPMSNTATVINAAAGPIDPTDPTRIGAGNNTATDSTNIRTIADMTITKTHGGTFTQGQVGATYTLTATNSGTRATTGANITVTDTLPAGLTATAIGGTGWACVLGTLTCTRNTVLAAGASFPAITLTVNVAANAPPSVTNTATVSGGGQVNTGNDTANDPTTIIQLVDMTIAKSHVGNFTQGQVGATYTITATNSGSTPTAGTVTVTDTLPAGLTATAINGAGWVCVLGTLTCTRNDALAAGASYPAITLTVNVANNAAASVTNSASVSGGGQTNTANDTANDLTTIIQLPDLSITKSHVGNFTQGQVGATYTITATNSGFAPTSGIVTVTDTLPAGLTATAISGAGWVCVLGTLTCTRSDVLLAGASYPAITLTVNVANNAAASVTNSASVSGGGQTNTANDTANDLTTVIQLPDLTIAKSHAGNFTQGQTGATYTITVTNSGFAATSGMVTVTDTLPAGLTATAISGTGWSCVLGTLTCTRNDALAVSASYPVITLTVDVSLTAPGSVTNSATVSGGGENNASNNTANDLTTIDAAAPPSISLVKSVSPGGTQSPGTDLLYTIDYSNTGGQPATTVVIVDPNMLNVDPLERVFHNVDFKVGSITSSPGTTGLVATFEYSNDAGATWTYTPVSGGGGAPAGYDRLVTNVRWTFAGNLSQTPPNNAGSVGLTVRIR